MKIQSAICTLLLVLICANHAFSDTAPASTLDAFHQAGADADAAAFLALLTTDAVLLGVNGKQRLEGQSLRRFVSESISRSGTWNYRSNQREIKVSADGMVAWFDESLERDHLESGWGSGVLVNIGTQWKIAQYNTSLPAPDDIAATADAVDQESAETVPTAPPKKKECRQVRHKTNKRANC